ncbi:hypothetical protein [Fontivita pretiosa]|uniref:hypothetical protein n=1 Tax=Fontivita pretiosa TaxID=2989684 RepID=UPI003D17CFAC
MPSRRNARGILTAILSSVGLIGPGVAAAQSTVSWINPAGGQWSAPSNWSAGTAPGPEDHAVFDLGSPGGYTVSFSANVSSRSLSLLGDRVTFDLAGNTYAVMNSGSLTAVHAGSSAGPTEWTLRGGGALSTGSLGAARIAQQPYASVILNVEQATTLQTDSLFVGSGSSVARININGGQLLSRYGNVRVLEGSTINYNSGVFSVGTLDLDKGHIALGSGGDKVVHAFGVLGRGVIDLNDNAMVRSFNNGGGWLEMMLYSGYNAGRWDGPGIRSSAAAANPRMALGYGDGWDLAISSFLGYPLNYNSTLVRYTYYGDANLDGVVNIRDLRALAKNWKRPYSRWVGGDFNYDDQTDALDLKLLAMNWSGGIASLNEALASLELPQVSVPEPGVAAVLILAATLRSRQRNR